MFCSRKSVLINYSNENSLPQPLRAAGAPALFLKHYLPISISSNLNIRILYLIRKKAVFDANITANARFRRSWRYRLRLEFDILP
jgi:hypothetical protein